MPRTKRATKPAPPGMRAADPPEPESPDWAAAAAWCRAHPMQWLEVYTSGRTTWVSAVRQRHVQVVNPSLGFEVKTTNNTHGQPRTCDCYMRFNPDLVDPVAEAIRVAREEE